MFSSAALSRLHFSMNLHPTYTFLYSSYYFVWVCKSAHSVWAFYPIWQAKKWKTEKIEKKTLISVDLDPLMMKMFVFRPPDTLFPIKITGITDILNFWYQLCNTHSFSDRCWSQSEILDSFALVYLTAFRIEISTQYCRLENNGLQL